MASINPGGGNSEATYASSRESVDEWKLFDAVRDATDLDSLARVVKVGLESFFAGANATIAKNSQFRSPKSASIIKDKNGCHVVAPIYPRPIGVYERPDSESTAEIASCFVVTAAANREFDEIDVFLIQRAIGLYAIARRLILDHKELANSGFVRKASMRSFERMLDTQRKKKFEDEATEYLSRRSLQDSVLEFHPKPIIIVRDDRVHQVSRSVKKIFPEMTGEPKSWLNHKFLTVFKNTIPGIHKRLTNQFQFHVLKLEKSIVNVRIAKLTDGWLLEIENILDFYRDEFRRPLTDQETQEISINPTQGNSLESYIHRFLYRLATHLTNLPIEVVSGSNQMARWQVALLIYEDGFFWKNSVAYGSLYDDGEVTELEENQDDGALRQIRPVHIALAEYQRTLDGQSEGTLCKWVANRPRAKRKSVWVSNIRNQITELQGLELKLNDHYRINLMGSTKSKVDYRLGNMLTETEFCIPVSDEGGVLGAVIDVQTDWQPGSDDNRPNINDALRLLTEIGKLVGPEVCGWIEHNQIVRENEHKAHLSKAISSVPVSRPGAYRDFLTALSQIRRTKHEKERYFLEYLELKNGFLECGKEAYVEFGEVSVPDEKPIPVTQNHKGRGRKRLAAKSTRKVSYPSVCAAAIELGRTICFQASTTNINRSKKRRVWISPDRRSEVSKFEHGPPGMTSELAVPVQFEGHRFGVLNFESEAEDLFGRPEIEAFELFAKMLASVFHASASTAELQSHVQSATQYLSDNSSLLNSSSHLFSRIRRKLRAEPGNSSTISEWLEFEELWASFLTLTEDRACTERESTLLSDLISSARIDAIHRCLLEGDSVFRVPPPSPDIEVDTIASGNGRMAMASLICNLVQNHDKEVRKRHRKSDSELPLLVNYIVRFEPIPDDANDHLRIRLRIETIIDSQVFEWQHDRDQRDKLKSAWRSAKSQAEWKDRNNSFDLRGLREIRRAASWLAGVSSAKCDDEKAIVLETSQVKGDASKFDVSWVIALKKSLIAIDAAHLTPKSASAKFLYDINGDSAQKGFRGTPLRKSRHNLSGLNELACFRTWQSQDINLRPTLIVSRSASAEYLDDAAELIEGKLWTLPENSKIDMADFANEHLITAVACHSVDSLDEFPENVWKMAIGHTMFGSLLDHAYLLSAINGNQESELRLRKLWEIASLGFVVADRELCDQWSAAAKSLGGSLQVFDDGFVSKLLDDPSIFSVRENQALLLHQTPVADWIDANPKKYQSAWEQLCNGWRCVSLVSGSSERKNLEWLNPAHRFVFRSNFPGPTSEDFRLHIAQALGF